MKKLLFIFLLFVWFAWAMDIPAPVWYVNDFEHILSSDQTQSLESELSNFHQQTSSEISIVTVPDLQGEDISMLATEIGQKRWVGDAKYDRWLLIVVAPNDREWFIAVGYGLEGTIPDAIAKRIGEANFPSYFRDGDYFGGLSAALGEIESYIQADPTVVEQYSTNSQDMSWQDTAWVWFFFVLIVTIFLFSMIKSKRIYWALAWIWIVVLISILSSVIVLGLFFGTFVWVMIVASIFGKRWGWSMGWFGWGSGWSSGGLSWWFGGFWWGSFGGGGAGGKR